VEILLNKNDNNEEILSYICIPSRKRGKFLPKEAKKLGCNPKAHFKNLANGIEVTLDDGTLIKPEQVMEASLPSEAFIINFFPDESYMDAVVSNPKYEQFFIENISPNAKIAVMYHSTKCLEIFKNEKYLDFMRKFGPNVNHVIDCKALNTEVLTKWKAMTLSNQYHQICPRLYPLATLNLLDFNTMNYPQVEENLKDFKITFAKSGLNIELYPAKSSGIFESDVITPQNLQNEEDLKNTEFLLAKNEEIVQNSTLLKDLDINNVYPEVKFKNEPEVFFLGTISMKPTGTRSASCIYLNIPGKYSEGNF